MLRKITRRKNVRNGIKTKVNNIEFDSKFEAFAYQHLITKTTVEIKPTFELIPSFTYLNEKVRSLTWTPDFFLPEYNTIIEIKGLPNDAFPLRLKLMKYRESFKNTPLKVLIVTSKESLINLCKNIEILNTITHVEFKKIDLSFKKIKQKL